MGKIKSKVMEKIENKDIKMKSKYWFLLENMAWVGLFVLCLVLGSSVLVGIHGWGVVQGWWESRELFWEELPVAWFALAGVALAGSLWLYGKLGEHYRETREKRIIKVVLVIALLLLIGWLLEEEYLLGIILKLF